MSSLLKQGTRLFLVLFFAAALAGNVLAQAPTGNVRGEVTDPTGAVVPGASVKVTEVATGRTIELQTNDAGLYSGLLLLPGTYRIRVEASGFVPAEAEVVVRAGQTTDANISLKVGAAVGAVVEVVSIAEAQVDTTRSTIDGVITSQQIDQLPLDARNFLDLASLEAGVLVRDGGSIDPTKERTYRTVGVVGRSGTATRIQIDGVDVTDETVGTTVANLSDDAVQEFQLTRSSLDLTTSLTSSGAVNIITRGGSNEIHGSGFWYYRNQDMGARLGFLTESEPFARTQVGYRVGGPFVKDKLFWFSNWERTYQDERRIFTSSAYFPVVPFGSANNCLTGCDAGMPLGIRMMSQRLDWNIRPNVRLFYRFGYDWNRSTGGTVPVSPFQNLNWTTVHTVALDWSHGKMTHSYRFGFVNFNNRIISESFSGFEFPVTPQGSPYYLGVEAYGIGPNSLAPQETYQDNFQNKYDGTYVWGKHTFRYGLELNRIVLGGFANFAGPLSVSGEFSDSIRADVIAAGGNPQNPLEYPLSGFSSGPDAGFFTVKGCHGYEHGCHKNTRFAWYFADIWRLKNVAFTIGTRWEYDSGYFNDEEGITRPSYLNFYADGIATAPKFPKDRFGPQFGFAWDPWGDGKTSVRGGFYLAYEMNIYNNLLFDQLVMIPPGIGPDYYDNWHFGLPNGDPITPAVAGIVTLPASCIGAEPAAELAEGTWNCLLSNPIKDVIGIIGQLNNTLKNAYATYQFSPTGTPYLEIIGMDYGQIIGGTTFKIPYSTQWNIGIQRELKPGHVFSVDYLYNFGVGMPFLGVELECRRCAKTLNATAALARRDSVLTGAGFPATLAGVDLYIAAYPTRTISTFDMGTDTRFPGLTPSASAPAGFLQTTGLTRLRTMMGGGFSKYRGLHVVMRGRLREKLGIIKNMTYTGGWSWSVAEATNASGRSEFLNTAQNKFRPNDDAYFGPTGLDREHSVSGSILLDIPGGFRFGQIWTFRTAPPVNLWMPEIVLTSRHALFATDINGDGNSGSGSPLGDPLPGTGLGDFGRRIDSWQELNLIIGAYNANYAGKLTPAGQALVTAGIFTEAQMKSLKAVMPTIAAVPEGNPWPFNNFFNLDLSITRPIKLSQIREGLVVEPWLQIFNVFNHTGLNTYGGLTARFGSLNYDYWAPANQSSAVCGGNCVAALTAQRGRNGITRLMQIGVRVSF